VQRHLARLAELAVAHDQELVREVEVAAVEADRFPDPHPGDRDQPDQRPVGRDPQREAQGVGGGDQRRDLRVGVQVGRRPWRPAREQVLGRTSVAGSSVCR